VTDFEALMTEALRAPTEGWDLARFGSRLTGAPPPWSFRETVAAQATGVAAMLDMGTGGGEQLASCQRLAPLTVATESWPPNVTVAARRLSPLGVFVVQAEGAPDNLDQTPDELGGRLPFRDASFDLVVNRHESFNAREVARVLTGGGVFLTQQAGEDRGDLHALLRLDRPKPPRLTLALAARQVLAAGLRLEASGEAVVAQTFADVGALGWYLRQVAWAVPGFDVEVERDRLRAVHERILAGGPVSVRQHQFWLRAVRSRRQ
jgi:SAM-dependent methyltransferase